MRINLYLLLETILIIAISIFWCEVGYYYFVFYFNCSSWPGQTPLSSSTSNTADKSSLTKFMIISDTHIMGPIKSVRLDKWRREWQMKQAFSISNQIFKPDIVVFMGDLLDEGSFSRDESFAQACQDFERIFSIDRGQQELIIIPGNHDVGFHEQMRNFPYLLARFSDKYKSTASIEFAQTPKTRNLNIIVSNSMSFYNDTCPYCSFSMAQLQRIEKYLTQQRELDPEEYTAPILLGHIPLFRTNDLNCKYPSHMAKKVAKTNVEGEDVIHQAASIQILTRLRPRLAISGHTHMLCETRHQIPADDEQSASYDEITISSYNHKYAESRPGFLLMTVNSSHVFTKHCYLIEEWVVVSIYVASLLTVVFRFILMNRGKASEEELCLNTSHDEEQEG